jgi:hypothetical protein
LIVQYNLQDDVDYGKFGILSTACPQRLDGLLVPESTTINRKDLGDSLDGIVTREYEVHFVG